MHVKSNIQYVFLPDNSHGSGHFIRCLRLAKRLGGYIFVSSTFLRKYFSLHIQNEYSADTEQKIRNTVQRMCRILLPNVRFAWVQSQFREVSIEKLVFDKMTITSMEVRSWEASLKIGLDVEGSGKSLLDYTIDMLHADKSTANVVDSSYLFLPTARRLSWPKRIQKVLVLFGLRDQPKKASTLVKLLSQRFRAIQFHTMLEHSQNDDFNLNVSEYFYEYDLIITHYGLTMYEALWARVPVFLINPSSYHQKLSKKRRLFSVEWSSENLDYGLLIKTFQSCVGLLSELVNRCQDVAPKDDKSLPHLLHSLVSPEDRVVRPVVSRSSEKSVVKHSDGLYHAHSFSPKKITYDANYFGKEYKKQYGQSYINDFKNIYNLGIERLDTIKKYVNSGRLLDIGCAYGHFLRAASDRNFDACGVDISEEAVQYATESAGLRAFQLDIEHDSLERIFQKEGLDVITMWYVLEHFRDPLSILQSVLPFLRSGGMFAFSAPSLAGISARKNMTKFFENNPSDHYSFFDPRYLHKSFLRLSIRLVTWRSTGHHSERIHKILGQSRYLNLFGTFISKAVRLGDTFEAYFIKD